MKYATLVIDGDSRCYGSQTTDPMTDVVGSGTTTFAYIASRLNTGPRGTWLAQNIDCVDIHSINRGVSGRDYVIMNAQFAINIAPLVDGNRVGPFVAVTEAIGNTQGNNPSFTSSDVLAQIQAYTDAVHALGGKHYVMTCDDRGNWYTGGVINAAGTLVKAVNTGLRTLAYCDDIIDIEADVSNDFKIERPTTLAYTRTAVYPDGVHWTDAAQLSVGTIVKNKFDVNDNWLFPARNVSLQSTTALALRLSL